MLCSQCGTKVSEKKAVYARAVARDTKTGKREVLGRPVCPKCDQAQKSRQSC